MQKRSYFTIFLILLLLPLVFAARNEHFDEECSKKTVNTIDNRVTCQSIWNCLHTKHMGGTSKDPEKFVNSLFSTLGNNNEMIMIVPDDISNIQAYALKFAHKELADNPVKKAPKQLKQSDMDYSYFLRNCNVANFLSDKACEPFADLIGKEGNAMVPVCAQGQLYTDPQVGLRYCDVMGKSPGQTQCKCLIEKSGDISQCDSDDDYRTACKYNVLMNKDFMKAFPVVDDIVSIADKHIKASTVRRYPDEESKPSWTNRAETSQYPWHQVDCASGINLIALKIVSHTPSAKLNQQLLEQIMQSCRSNEDKECHANRVWSASDSLYEAYKGHIGSFFSGPIPLCKEPFLKLINKEQSCSQCWETVLDCYENVLGKEITRKLWAQRGVGAIDGFFREQFAFWYLFRDLGKMAAKLGGAVFLGITDPQVSAEQAARALYSNYCMLQCEMENAAPVAQAGPGSWMIGKSDDSRIAGMISGRKGSEFNGKSGKPVNIGVNLIFGPDFVKEGKLDPEKVKKCPEPLLQKMKLERPGILSSQNTVNNDLPWTVRIGGSAYVTCPHNLKQPRNDNVEEYYIWDNKERICKSGAFKDDENMCYFSGKKPVGVPWKKPDTLLGKIGNGALGLATGFLLDSYDQSGFKARAVQPITVVPAKIKDHVLGMVVQCTRPVDNPKIVTIATMPKIRWEKTGKNFRPITIKKRCKFSEPNKCDPTKDEDWVRTITFHNDAKIKEIVENEDWSSFESIVQNTLFYYECEEKDPEDDYRCKRIKYWTKKDLQKEIQLKYDKCTDHDKNEVVCYKREEDTLSVKPIILDGEYEGKYYPFMRPLDTTFEGIPQASVFTRSFDPEGMIDSIYELETSLFNQGKADECTMIYTGGYYEDGSGKLVGHAAGLALVFVNPTGLLGKANKFLQKYPGFAGKYVNNQITKAGSAAFSRIKNFIFRSKVNSVIDGAVANTGDVAGKSIVQSVTGESVEQATETAMQGTRKNFLSGIQDRVKNLFSRQRPTAFTTSVGADDSALRLMGANFDNVVNKISKESGENAAKEVTEQVTDIGRRELFYHLQRRGFNQRALKEFLSDPVYKSIASSKGGPQFLEAVVTNAQNKRLILEGFGQTYDVLVRRVNKRALQKGQQALVNKGSSVFFKPGTNQIGSTMTDAANILTKYAVAGQVTEEVTEGALRQFISENGDDATIKMLSRQSPDAYKALIRAGRELTEAVIPDDQLARIGLRKFDQYGMHIFSKEVAESLATASTLNRFRGPIMDTLTDAAYARAYRELTENNLRLAATRLKTTGGNYAEMTIDSIVKNLADNKRFSYVVRNSGLFGNDVLDKYVQTMTRQFFDQGETVKRGLMRRILRKLMNGKSRQIALSEAKDELSKELAEEALTNRLVKNYLDDVAKHYARAYGVSVKRARLIVGQLAIADDVSAKVGREVLFFSRQLPDDAAKAIPQSFFDDAAKFLANQDVIATRQAETLIKSGGIQSGAETLSRKILERAKNTAIRHTPVAIEGGAHYIGNWVNPEYGVDWTQNMFAWAANLWLMQGVAPINTFAEKRQDVVPDASAKMCQEGWERIELSCLKDDYCGNTDIKAQIPEMSGDIAAAFDKAIISPLKEDDVYKPIPETGICPAFMHRNKQEYYNYLEKYITFRADFFKELKENIESFKSAIKTECNKCNEEIKERLIPKYKDCQFAEGTIEKEMDAAFASLKNSGADDDTVQADRGQRHIIGDILLLQDKENPTDTEIKTIREQLAKRDYAEISKLCTNTCLYLQDNSQGTGPIAQIDKITGCSLINKVQSCNKQSNPLEKSYIDPKGVVDCVKDVMTAKEHCTLLGMSVFTSDAVTKSETRGVQQTGDKTRRPVILDFTKKGSDDPCTVTEKLDEMIDFIDKYVPKLNDLKNSFSHYRQAIQCLDQSTEVGKCKCADTSAQELCRKLNDNTLQRKITQLFESREKTDGAMSPKEFKTRLRQLSMASIGDIEDDYYKTIASLYFPTEQAQRSRYVVYKDHDNPADRKNAKISIWWDIVTSPTTYLYNKVPFAFSPGVSTNSKLNNKCVCGSSLGGCFSAYAHPEYGENCEDYFDYNYDTNFYNDNLFAGQSVIKLERWVPKQHDWDKDEEKVPTDYSKDSSCGELATATNIIFPKSDEFYKGNTKIDRAWYNPSRYFSDERYQLNGKGNGWVWEEGKPSHDFRLVNSRLGKQWKALFEKAKEDAGLKDEECNYACGRGSGKAATEKYDRCVQAKDETDNSFDSSMNFPFLTKQHLDEFYINSAYKSYVPAVCSGNADISEKSKSGLDTMINALKNIASLDKNKFNQLFPDPNCFGFRGTGSAVDTHKGCADACKGKNTVHSYCRAEVGGDGVRGYCYCDEQRIGIGTPAYNDEGKKVECVLPKPDSFYKDLLKCCTGREKCNDFINHYNGRSNEYACLCGGTVNKLLDVDACVRGDAPRLELESAYYKVKNEKVSRAFQGEKVKACVNIKNTGGAGFTGTVTVDLHNQAGQEATGRAEICSDTPECNELKSITLNNAVLNQAQTFSLGSNREMKLTLTEVTSSCTFKFKYDISHPQGKEEGKTISISPDKNDPDKRRCAFKDVFETFVMNIHYDTNTNNCKENLDSIGAIVSIKKETHRGKCKIDAGSCKGAPSEDKVAKNIKQACRGSNTARTDSKTIAKNAIIEFCSSELLITPTLIGSSNRREIGMTINAVQGESYYLQDMKPDEKLTIEKAVPGILDVYLKDKKGKISTGFVYPNQKVEAVVVMKNTMGRTMPRLSIDADIVGLNPSRRLEKLYDAGQKTYNNLEDGKKITFTSNSVTIDKKHIGYEAHVAAIFFDSENNKMSQDFFSDSSYKSGTYKIVKPELIIGDAYFKRPQDSQRIRGSRTCDKVKAFVGFENKMNIDFSGKLEISIAFTNQNAKWATHTDNSFNLKSGESTRTLLSSEELQLPSPGRYLIHVKLTDKDSLIWYDGVLPTTSNSASMQGLQSAQLDVQAGPTVCESEECKGKSETASCGSGKVCCQSVCVTGTSCDGSKPDPNKECESKSDNEKCDEGKGICCVKSCVRGKEKCSDPDPLEECKDKDDDTSCTNGVCCNKVCTKDKTKCDGTEKDPYEECKEKADDTSCSNDGICCKNVCITSRSKCDESKPDESTPDESEPDESKPDKSTIDYDEDGLTADKDPDDRNPDIDDDGIKDGDEVEGCVQTPDCDGDGLGDEIEIQIDQRCVTNPDCDGDKVGDYSDYKYHEDCILMEDCDEDTLDDLYDPGPRIDDYDDDGIPDGIEIKSCLSSTDCDGDLILDNDEEEGCIQKSDCDGDGVSAESDPDDKNPTIPENKTEDADGDTVLDEDERSSCNDVDCKMSEDCDDDGLRDDKDPDDCNTDTDGDGVKDGDEEEGCVTADDCDGDRLNDKDDPNDHDKDSDDDLVLDGDEEAIQCVENPDCDDDGLPDGKDPNDLNGDIDKDGVPDGDEEPGCEKTDDCDGDGIKDKEDIDDKKEGSPDPDKDTDGDGVLDINEEPGCIHKVDCDGDGLSDDKDPDDHNPDTDSDGVKDGDEKSIDCVENPSNEDECEHPLHGSKLAICGDGICSPDENCPDDCLTTDIDTCPISISGESKRYYSFTYCTGGGCNSKKNGEGGCYLSIECKECPNAFHPKIELDTDGKCRLANAECCNCFENTGN